MTEAERLAKALVQALWKERDDLRAELEALRDNWTGCAETCSRLHKENGALRADAERYRWLRGVGLLDIAEAEIDAARQS